MPKTVISELKGLNSTTASLQLKPGEVPNLQNLRTRPFYNWAKRQGVEGVTSKDGPILGVFEIDLDNIIIPLFIAGPTLTFFPDLATESGSLPNPDPNPTTNPLDPPAVLFLIEPTMRAVSERYGRLNLNPADFAQFFDYRAFDENGLIPGTTIDPVTRLVKYGSGGEAPAQTAGTSYNPSNAYFYDTPVNNFYRYDLASFDTYFGYPVGTRAADLENMIIGNVAQNGGMDVLVGSYGPQYFVKEIDGLPAPDPYTDVNLPLPSYSTPSTYKQNLTTIKTALRKLTGIILGPYDPAASEGVTSFQFREGVGADPVPPNNNCATAIANANINLAASSFAVSGAIAPRQTSTTSTGPAAARGLIDRCKLNIDLTDHTTGSATIWMSVDFPPVLFPTLGYNPPVSVSGTLELRQYTEESPVLGTNWTSTNYIGASAGSYDLITITGSCPVGGSDGLGWVLESIALIHTPTYTENF